MYRFVIREGERGRSLSEGVRIFQHFHTNFAIQTKKILASIEVMRLASATRRSIYDTFMFFCRWAKPSGVNLKVLEIFPPFSPILPYKRKKF